MLDFGPLLVFLVVNHQWGILAATAALVPTSVVALGVGWKLEGRVSPMALYSTIAVIVFGGLTLVFHDESFIKVKLTVIYALLGGVLGAGLLRGKALLKGLLGEAFPLTDEGWRRLTLRFTVFFFFLAALNEVLRRSLTTDAWVNFKVFGVLGLTFLFTVLQTPLLSRYARQDREA